MRCGTAVDFADRGGSLVLAAHDHAAYAAVAAQLVQRRHGNERRPRRGRKNAAVRYEFTGRTDIWTFAFQSLQQRLSTGYGFAAFWGASSIRDLPEGKEWAAFASHSHNGYLDTALAMGLPGLVLLVVVLVVGPLQNFHVADRGGNNGPLTMALLQIWLFGLYLSSMESFFLDRADPLWFTFLMAVFGLHYLARFRVSA